jgi:hypothetical protein
MVPKPTSVAYSPNPFHQSVCLYVYPPVVAGQRLAIHVLAKTNTRNTRRIVGRVVLYTVRVVSKGTLCACLSLFVSPSLIYVAPKRWSVDCKEPPANKMWSWVPLDRRRWIAATYWSVYPLVVASQRLKHVPAATKNCWRLRFLCSPCRIKGK